MDEMGMLFRQHMTLRGFADATKESYEYAMVDLVRSHAGTSPELLTCAQVKELVAKLIAERKLAWSTVNGVLTIPITDFIGRFLLHILPRGFQKVRAYGWLAPRHKTAVLAAIRKQLGASPPPPLSECETRPERILRLTGVDVTRCPVCAAGHLTYVGELPRVRDGPS